MMLPALIITLVTTSHCSALRAISLASNNIAYRQSATQSHSLLGRGAELAVDGDTDTCSTTPRTPEPRWWQVKLRSAELIQRVSVTMQSDSKQHFSIYVIELLDGSNALYKPCSQFEGYFKEPRVMFECNEGKGHVGNFIYIRDERASHEHFSVCEVEVIPFTVSSPDFVECDDPVSPLHGYTVLANYNGVNRVGSVATYKCNSGYLLHAETDHDVCAEDGTWQSSSSGDRSCEHITCQHPPEVDNSHIELLNETLTVGSVILYTCQHSYYSDVATCLRDGSWSRINLTCPQESRRSEEWLISPQIIAIISSGSVIVIIFVIIISIVFTRKRRISTVRNKKMGRLRHHFDPNTRVNKVLLYQ